jgi:hypothetical protein
LVAAFAAAQAPIRPNFSGDWKAIMEDGNLIPPYLGEDIKIDHREPSMTIKTTGEKPVIFRFAADGQEHANTGKGSVKVRTTARWDADALLLNSELFEPKGQRAIAKERWTLSPDGRKLQMQGYFETGNVKKNQLLEYQRK